jgi:hypothetical protein
VAIRRSSGRQTLDQGIEGSNPSSPANLPEGLPAYPGNRELTPARTFVGGWLNSSAAAPYHGHVNPRIARENLGQRAQIYWAQIRPLVPTFRANDPQLWKDWERCVDELADRDRKAGKVTDVSPARLARVAPQAIAYFIERLRLEEDARTGVIPVWPAPTQAITSSPADAQVTGAARRSS